MKPKLIHYFFAKGWHFKGYFLAWAITGAVLVVYQCQPNLEMLGDWKFDVWFVAALVLVPAFAASLAIPAGFLFLVPLSYLGERLAGAPFQAGDRVRVLVGPHRDRVVDVYEVWAERREIRVWLDAEAQKKVQDVFSCTQVLRQSVRAEKS